MDAPVRDPLHRVSISVFAVLLFSAARAVLLMRRPMWHDELFTLWAARQSPSHLWQALRHDSGPPLFYLLEKPFVTLGEAMGTDTLARLLPFLAALLLFAGAFSLEQRTARSCFLILLAVSPFLLVYAAEARAYAVLAALDFGLFLLLFRSRPTAARLITAALLVALVLWTHYVAIFFVVSMALLLIARRRWMPLAAVLAGSLLFLPWIPMLAAQPTEATAWMREPIGRSVVGLLSAFGGAGRIPDPLGGPLPAPLFWIAGAVSVFLLVAVARRLPKDAELANPVLLVFLTMSLILVTSLARPVTFAGRSEMAVLPVWLWAISRAASQSRAARWAVASAIACALVASSLILATRREEPEPSHAAALVSSLAQKEDLVIAAAAFYLPIRLAHDRGDLTAPVVALPLDLAQHPGWFAGRSPADSDYQAIQAALERLASGRRAFVLIHPTFRQARLSGLLKARGVVRVMSERPETVLLVCTAR